MSINKLINTENRKVAIVEDMSERTAALARLSSLDLVTDSRHSYRFTLRLSLIHI